MESAMGNRELEELWAEKEQRREEKVNSNLRKMRKYHILEMTVVSASGRKKAATIWISPL